MTLHDHFQQKYRELKGQYEDLSERIQYLRKARNVSDLSPNQSFDLEQQIKTLEEEREEINQQLEVLNNKPTSIIHESATKEVSVPSDTLWDGFKKSGIIKAALLAISSISIPFIILHWIMPPKTPPIIIDLESKQIPEDSCLSINLINNTGDNDCQQIILKDEPKLRDIITGIIKRELTLKIKTNPKHGKIEDNGILIYTPNLNSHKQDNFSFNILQDDIFHIFSGNNHVKATVGIKIDVQPENDPPILVNSEGFKELKNSLDTDENKPLGINLSNLYKDPDTNEEMENTSLVIKISKPEDKYGEARLGLMEDGRCQPLANPKYDEYVDFNPEKSCIQYEPKKIYFDEIRKSGNGEVSKVVLHYTISDRGNQPGVSVEKHPEKLIIYVQLINDLPKCEPIQEIVPVTPPCTRIPINCKDLDNEEFTIEFDKKEKPDWIGIIGEKNKYELDICPDDKHLEDHTFRLVARDDQKESKEFVVNIIVQEKGPSFIPPEDIKHYLLKDTKNEDYDIYRKYNQWDDREKKCKPEESMYFYLNDYSPNRSTSHSDNLTQTELRLLKCADKVTYYSIVKRLGYSADTALEAPQIRGLECKDLRIINYYWDKNTSGHFSLQAQKDFLHKKIKENNGKLENIDYVNWASELGWLWLGQQSDWEQEKQDWNYDYKNWFVDRQNSCEERYDNEECIISYANKIYDKLGEEEIHKGLLPLGGMFAGYSYDVPLYSSPDPLTLAEVKAHAKSLLKCKLTKNDIKYEYKSGKWQ
ncbi:MAG: hypothetical protein F6K08_30070 [Okeania sp. SIO1H6]|nr:hypothetical protein [Okeania sp. SIO1H6]